MRPDTPQLYEYITVEEMAGKVDSFMNIHPWTQFYDLKDRKDIPMSEAQHITMRNCNCECDIFFNIEPNVEQYRLSDFTFENLKITAGKAGFEAGIIQNVALENVAISKP